MRTQMLLSMPRLVLLLVACLSFVFQCAPLLGVETIKFRTADKERTASGKILVEAQDGGVMLQADDGQIWTLQPEDIIERKSDDRPHTPIDADQMQIRLQDELGPGFEVYRTQHYVILFNSTEAYAKQVGALFEQLYRSFFIFWKNQRWELPEPEYPPRCGVKLVEESAENLKTCKNRSQGSYSNFSFPLNLTRIDPTVRIEGY